jgi:hypothetical protein
LRATPRRLCAPSARRSGVALATCRSVSLSSFAGDLRQSAPDPIAQLGRRGAAEGEYQDLLGR